MRGRRGETSRSVAAAERRATAIFRRSPRTRNSCEPSANPGSSAGIPPLPSLRQKSSGPRPDDHDITAVHEAHPRSHPSDSWSHPSSPRTAARLQRIAGVHGPIAVCVADEKPHGRGQRRDKVAAPSFTLHQGRGNELAVRKTRSESRCSCRVVGVDRAAARARLRRTTRARGEELTSASR